MELSLIVLVPVLAIIAALTWIFWHVLKGVRFLVVRVFRSIKFLLFRVLGLVRSILVDSVQFVGAMLTAGVLLPLTGINFVIGRWATARHYGRAIEDELVSAGYGLYRMAIANPLRFIGLGALLAGVERRIPDVVDRAPRQAPKRSAARFEGYDVVGTLPTGGSGALLFRARPQPDTIERLRREGKCSLKNGDEVVIKSFAMLQGSTLPQIVRESRALEAAKKLGLVYDHHLDDESFYYVMEYVKGEDLDTVIQRLHGRSRAEGLGNRELGHVLGYAQDLLRNLERFHAGGLWHKDVKPANLIVSHDRAVLVDFGLVTPLHSALTLTTHGTEYYRDPEMVRLAMQGVKVHEVDGVKFDLYSAGAVLFSMVENSFPAHGSLSQITKRCPEVLSWIVRRSMADIESRYRGAWQMLDDVAAVAAASDPFAMRVADLPSVKLGDSEQHAENVAAQDAEHDDPDLSDGFISAAATAASEGKRSSTSSSLLADRRGPRRRTSRKSRRRRIAAVALAVLAFNAVRFSNDNRSSSSRANASVTVSQSDDSGFESTLTLEDQRYVDTVRPALAEVRATPRARAERIGSTQEAERVAAESDGRVLLLDDPSNGPSEKDLKSIRGEWEERGFRIVPEAEMGIIERARYAAGTGIGGLDELQAYLDNTTDDVDVIVWVSGDEHRVLARTKQDEPSFWDGRE